LAKIHVTEVVKLLTGLDIFKDSFSKVLYNILGYPLTPGLTVCSLFLKAALIVVRRNKYVSAKPLLAM
jgi:hypothetical protein